jgi:probable HAF family extracellular repeat protein
LTKLLVKALSTPYLRRWLVPSVCLIALTLLAAVPALRSRAQGPATTYTITDLGTLGGTESKAYGINNCGNIVGDSTTGGAFNRNHPFFKKDTASPLTDIGTFGGHGSASAINASGYVVGSAGNLVGAVHAFIWRDNNGNGVSDSGELIDIGILPGSGFTAQAFDINDSGLVVGQSETSTNPLIDRAFRWDFNQQQMQEIPAFPSIDPFAAYGVNNSGHIVGVGRATSGEIHGFFLNGTQMIDLGTLGGTVSIATEVNETGYVVGHSRLPAPSANVPDHAFIWRDANSNGLSDPGEMKDLGTLPGGIISIAHDINSNQQVVGTDTVFLVNQIVNRPFIWEDANNDGDGEDPDDLGEMKDLNLLIPPGSGWTLHEARSINDSGQIVGFGTFSGQTHAYLLTPVGFGGSPGCPTPTPTPTPDVTVVVSPSSVPEDGATNLTYTFSRTGFIANPLTVNFSVSETATFSTDYTQTGAATFSSSSGTVTFDAGSSTATVTLNPAVDSTVEADETVILTVTSGTGYNVGSPSAATGTITNDDTDVTIAVSPSSVAEDGVTNPVYTFTRNGVTSGALTVNFSVGGTATFSTDYTQAGAASFTSSSGTVTFGAGNTTATVTVDPIADSTDELIKTVILTVTSGSGYNVGSPNAATGSITADAPIIFTEEGTNNAAALDSVTFVRMPFRIFGANNFSADQRTRVILFTSNLGLTQPDSSLLSVQATGVTLPVENVGPVTAVPGLNASYVIVRLPDLPAGDYQLTVTLRGVTSNVTILSIAPP